MPKPDVAIEAIPHESEHDRASESGSDRDDATSRIGCSVVTLTHYLPPYMARVLLRVAQQVEQFKILLSIAEEPNRQFGNTWEGLQVEVQKSLMLRRPWKHQSGFRDELYIHFPYDTISQLRRVDPDIVFSYELGFRSLVSALYCKTHGKKLALCVCVSEHTEKGRGLFRRTLRRWLLKAASAVTYNGPSCQQYLKQFNVPDDKLFHFPYCASDEFQFDGPLERVPAANKRLMCIGQLNERKGVLPLVDGLIEYCNAQPNRSVAIDMIGSGKLENELRDKPLPSNLEVNLRGHLNYREIADAMQTAGILVFPTLADEWGLVVNEALQAGMPVLGSEYAQACTTLIDQGKNGWLYCPEEPQTLFDQLDKIGSLSDEQLNTMRVAAQQSVAHITPVNCAQSVVDMFRKLLRESKE